MSRSFFTAFCLNCSFILSLEYLERSELVYGVLKCIGWCIFFTCIVYIFYDFKDLRETLKMLNGGNGSKKRRSQSETSEAEYVPLAFSVGSHKGDADSRSLYSN